MYASVIASASRAGAVLATFEIVLVPLLLWGFRRTPWTQRRRRAAPHGSASRRLHGRRWMGIRVEPYLGARPIQRAPGTVPRPVRMAQSHPWFGIGLGTWPIVYPSYALIDTGSFANQAHNDWLQWTAEGGIPLRHPARQCLLLVPSSGVSLRLGHRRSRLIPPRDRGLPVLSPRTRLVDDCAPLAAGIYCAESRDSESP